MATRKIKKFHKRVTRTEIPNSEEKLFSSLSAFKLNFTVILLSNDFYPGNNHYFSFEIFELIFIKYSF